MNRGCIESCLRRSSGGNNTQSPGSPERIIPFGLPTLRRGGWWPFMTTSAIAASCTHAEMLVLMLYFEIATTASTRSLSVASDDIHL